MKMMYNYDTPYSLMTEYSENGSVHALSEGSLRAYVLAEKMLDKHYREEYVKYMNEPMEVEVVKTTSIDITNRSCVAVNVSPDRFPLRNANYFFINVGSLSVGVINFWYENMIEAIERFSPKEFTITIFGGNKGALIESPDIPREWYIRELFMKYNCSLDIHDEPKIAKYLLTRDNNNV